MVRQAGSEGHKSRFLQLTGVTKGREKDDAAQDLADQAPSSHHIPVRTGVARNFHSSCALTSGCRAHKFWLPKRLCKAEES